MPTSASTRRVPAPIEDSPQYLDHAEVTGAVDVRAPTQLARPIANGDHPDPIPVLLAEQSHRPRCHSFGLAHDLSRHRQVIDKNAVDASLDISQHRGRHCGGVWRSRT